MLSMRWTSSITGLFSHCTRWYSIRAIAECSLVYHLFQSSLAATSSCSPPRPSPRLAASYSSRTITFLLASCLPAWTPDGRREGGVTVGWRGGKERGDSEKWHLNAATMKSELRMSLEIFNLWPRPLPLPRHNVRVVWHHCRLAPLRRRSIHWTKSNPSFPRYTHTHTHTHIHTYTHTHTHCTLPSLLPPLDTHTHTDTHRHTRKYSRIL